MGRWISPDDYFQAHLHPSTKDKPTKSADGGCDGHDRDHHRRAAIYGTELEARISWSDEPWRIPPSKEKDSRGRFATQGPCVGPSRRLCCASKVLGVLRLIRDSGKASRGAYRMDCSLADGGRNIVSTSHLQLSTLQNST